MHGDIMDADLQDMASQIAETLLGPQNDLARIHRRVVRIGAVAGWAAAAFFLVAGFASGDQDLFVEAIGPILAAGLMTSQIVLGREHGGVALLGSAIVVMVMYGVIGNPYTLIPASLSLVIICAIGMLFVARYQLLVSAVFGVLLALTPVIWGVSFPTSVMLGTVMGLSFVMTSMIFYSVRNAAATLNTKLAVLFEQSPTAALEEDWAASIAYLRSAHQSRPGDLRAFLLANPAVVRRAVALAKVVRVNHAAISLLEATGPEDILGSRDPSIVNSVNLESFVDVLMAVYEGKEHFEVDVLSSTFQGHPIWIQARCVDNSRGTNPDSILIAMADITHVRANEEAMEQLIKAKDEFIASVSHELRTPLTAVLGLTAELSGDWVTDGERVELMSLVSAQAEEMSLIVEDLLVASRAELGLVSMAPTGVDLCAEVAASMESLGVQAKAGCQSLHLAYADPARVRQILRNLFTNLERYGGPNARVLCGQTEDRVWTEVRDDGDGVSREDTERIFEPYATAHVGVTASVGLGLSVARQLAELMGGSLTYRRETGESVFRLELPLSSASVAV